MKKAASTLMAIAGTAYAYTGSSAGTPNGCYWNVPGVGTFNTNFGGDWGTNLYPTIPDLNSSTYSVLQGVNPLARRFDIVNIGVDPTDQALTLTVPGGQTVGPISVAQMQTGYTDILYGSVRTVAKISNVPGTTHGFTFYCNDTQEIDFAFLTADISKAWLTNEQTAYGAPYTTYSVSAPSDANSAWHEYRVDWTPGSSSFYIDGTLVKTITDNVPTSPGMWIWNNWSNGNAWAQGPPQADNVLKIRKIDAYFNRTSVADKIAANPSACAAASSVIASSSASSIRASSSSINLPFSSSSSASSVVSSSTVSSPTSSSSASSSTSSSSVSSSSSSSSSSVSSSTSSSSSASSSVSTSSLAPPKTVSFTTITTGWTGTVTSTTTSISDLQAFVYVQTPVTASTGKAVTTKLSTTTTTTHSGTASSVGYNTIAPTVAGSPTTVQIVYPTPPTTCGNAGIAFAAYSNYFPGGQNTLSYPAYTPQAYKTAAPWFNSTTNYIAETNSGGNTINIYGAKANADATQLVLDHTFYLFASSTGYYSFNIPYTDDIQFVWIGGVALSGWTRSNANIIQFWSSQIATQTPQTLAYYLTIGTYLPVRVQWANGGGDGNLQFNLYGPDGSTVLSSTPWQNAGTSSPDIVQFPCNSALGASFPAWGKQT